MVRRLRGKSRWFPFGIGNSVNRNLIEGMAKAGGGEPDIVLLNGDSKRMAQNFFSRIESPVLTDVKVRFLGIKVTDVFPKQIADVWEQKPLYFQATYSEPGEGFAEITGYYAGKRYRELIPITLKDTEPTNDAIESTWARAKVDSLLEVDPSTAAANRTKITAVALAHHIMSRYTSFVAVENKVVCSPGKPSRVIEVPAQLPSAGDQSVTGHLSDSYSALCGISFSVSQRVNADPNLGLNEGTPWDIRRHYFMRFPVAGEFGPHISGGHDVIDKGRLLNTDPQASLRIKPPAHGSSAQPSRTPVSRKFSLAVRTYLADAINKGNYLRDLVRIKFVLNSSCPSVFTEIQQLGCLTITKGSNGTMYGTIPTRMLKRLAALPEITSIDLLTRPNCSSMGAH
jgi:hypothetical protein